MSINSSSFLVVALIGLSNGIRLILFLSYLLFFLVFIFYYILAFFVTIHRELEKVIHKFKKIKRSIEESS